MRVIVLDALVGCASERDTGMKETRERKTTCE
jgi:hypothetical protein